MLDRHQANDSIAEARRSMIFRLLVTAVSVALVFAGLYSVGPVVSNGIFFIPLGLISILAIRFGFSYGMLATVLSLVAENYLIIPPQFEWGIPDPVDRLRLGIFAGISLIVCWIGGSARSARFRSEESENRQKLLAEISFILADSLEPETRLANVTRLLVPGFADLSIRALVGAPNGSMDIRSSCKDPRISALCAELASDFMSEMAGKNFAPRAIYEHVGVVPGGLSNDHRSVAANSQRRQILHKIGIKSVVVVPLAQQGKVFGAIFFARLDTRLPYGRMDLSFAEDVTRRCSTVILSARHQSESSPVAFARSHLGR